MPSVPKWPIIIFPGGSISVYRFPVLRSIQLTLRFSGNIQLLISSPSSCEGWIQCSPCVCLKVTMFHGNQLWYLPYHLMIWQCRHESRFHVPSGKHTKNYAKSPIFMGKSVNPICLWLFSSSQTVSLPGRVYPIKITIFVGFLSH